MSELDDLMKEFVDTTTYVGHVEDWRDVPETDTSEDEPDDTSDTSDDTNE